MAGLAAEMAAKVENALKNTPFESLSLHVLSGGTGNFVYRAVLQTPLEDGTAEVLVKHGEDFVASNPAFKLTLSRCRIEEACLRRINLAPRPRQGKQWDFAVKTPACYHFDEATNTQVHELFPNGKDLKTYAIERFGAPSAPEQCVELGVALGGWLKRLHEWSSGPDEAARELRETVAKGSTETRGLKHFINFGWLVERADEYPDILGESRGVFEKIGEMARREMEEEGLAVIHGDFWTGNVLITDAPASQGTSTPLFVVDWELAHLGVPAMDLGQMVAELYMLSFVRGVTAGLWMVEGLVCGYGLNRDRELVLRTALQVGVHLIAFGTLVAKTGGWGEEAAEGTEMAERLARRGRDLVVMGWEKDVEGLGEDELGRVLLGL